MKKRLHIFKFTFLVFCIFFISSRVVLSDISNTSLRKHFSLPSNEWKWSKKSTQDQDKEFLSLNHKKLEAALSIDARTDYIPMDAKVYLVEIRKLLAEDKQTYKEAQVSPVEVKSLEGKDWQTFRINSSDGLRQELWTRKIGPLQVILFTYTSIGDTFEDYYGDFKKVLKQASKL
ncbi:MAG: hypothetical protein HQM15_04655 [Deltaproteobacteria bacterium]|nr:hypothetical protein [Deltaproteobacteria bacterium]